MSDGSGDELLEPDYALGDGLLDPFADVPVGAELGDGLLAPDFDHDGLLNPFEDTAPQPGPDDTIEPDFLNDYGDDLLSPDFE